ncbi:protein CASP [Phakopsora pachyrhizi]|uniref:Protein CASP n=1 Tax=Phakopsora pachyrhizi TaxID=170000 RepID=A0AAV0ASE6_PHAPC|nr:protein CASP [Phakopsora pachyrhizi]
MSTVLSDGSDFSRAISTWREINLTSLQKSLDQSGLEIVENQKDSLMGRKNLAEQTREFKKMSDEEKMGAFKGLLKAYQAEIDALTKRSKTSESAFLNIYKLLAEAPDPYPLLDAAVDQTVRANEAKLLESELSQATEQIKTLKTQLKESEKLQSDHKREVEKNQRLESRLEESVRAQVSNKEAELNAVYGERIMNFQQREKDLIKQLDITKKQLSDLRMSDESNQAKILDDSSRREFETVSRRAEIEMVEADLERCQRRVEEVERRNEKLRAEIEAVRSGSEARDRVNALETQITELQGEISTLLSTLETQKQTITQTREEKLKVEEDCNKRIRKLEDEILTLRGKVSQYSDYDEIKRELEIIKYVEFSSLNAEEEGEEEEEDLGHEESNTSSVNLTIKMPNPNAEKANRQQTKSLENLLMAKNRKLQDDLTNLRVIHDELLSSSGKRTVESERMKSELEEVKRLNERLENDILKIQSSGGGVKTSVQFNKDHGRSSSLSQTEASMIQSHPLEPSSSSSSSTTQKESIPPPSQTKINQESRLSAESSILPIITSQRDRFRQRNAELEEELRRQFESMTSCRNEIKSLQADNLKLYEKVRYLQSYSNQQNSGSSIGGVEHVDGSGWISSSRNRPSNEVSRKDEELSKYRGLYEDHMNPFEKFRGRERMGALRSLNPLDKLVLSLANFVLGNRLMRNLMMVYLIMVHLILFFSFSESALKYVSLQISFSLSLNISYSRNR